MELNQIYRMENTITPSLLNSNRCQFKRSDYKLKGKQNKKERQFPGST
jgi:hypothetical protein